MKRSSTRCISARLGSHIFPNDNGIELVRSLKGRVHQYAVTNGSAVAQERKLSVSGLDKLFDGIFHSVIWLRSVIV